MTQESNSAASGESNEGRWDKFVKKCKSAWSSFRDSRSSTRNILLLLVVIALFFVVTVYLPDPLRPGVLDILFIGFLLFLPLFVFLFTLPLPDDKHTSALQSADERESYTKLKQWWMFVAYSFMFVAMLSAIYPFTLDLRHEADDKRYIAQVHRTLDSMIGLFRGCTTDDEAKGLPVHCYPTQEDEDNENRRPIWLLHIGAQVTAIDNPLLNERRREELLRSIKADRQALDALLQEYEQAELALAEADSNYEQAEEADKPEAKSQFEKAQAALRDREHQLHSTMIRLLKYQLGDEDGIDVRADQGYEVRGGLVVPFYLIVISLSAGAVSLTRRIPEFQKQAAPGYVATEKEPALLPAALREKIVFQIIQFISAPFIATVAYYIIQPHSTATTVGLAFAAGFSSETVLKLVRQAVDKINPEEEPQPSRGSVAGTILQFRTCAAADWEKKITLGIVGHANLSPVYFDDGQFSIDGVPEGEQALEVIYKPDPPAASEIRYQKVKVQPGRSVTVLVDIKAAEDNEPEAES